MQVLYTASARATGDGRDGHVRTSDGTVELDLAVPKEMGGAGGAANPEQLFAAGYAACFHSALRVVARQAKADVSGSVVEAEVGIGPNGSGGYGLAVTLVVDLPAVERAAAEQLVDAAHQVCPYSNATRGNVEVTRTVREAR
ncbi:MULTISPECIES: organic hydroperoxide resistance protein [Micromonospora]|uniref:Peroxiredoxin, Ohr subfamily n=1 Tax=Micromonospora marina TaxID=307120 RepID=A0A1C4XPD7_9ACTN|nr:MULTISPECIES: organic hydroperoxide resistance protein [Micromonospora]NED51651.1 organic hydroperoxide resistance protein [Micromonospora aurantiaca]MBF5031337.1 organic hydroperoxide resistance protein [Micromonospora sp. ANENR4]MCZ7476580.1 organic hydroperoxide resistance protein [Micromonospora sp. WMMC273]MDW3849138.1 organic hydroperoxide resistance protein [Micromonospora sp. BRA006-A]RBJ05767.1 organic hydroperoxide resistance protein [Micromonospora provocatoris]